MHNTKSEWSHNTFNPVRQDQDLAKAQPDPTPIQGRSEWLLSATVCRLDSFQFGGLMDSDCTRLDDIATDLHGVVMTCDAGQA